MVEHNPRATLPEGVKIVAPEDAHEHGYWGAVPDQEPNEAYTVAGVTAKSEVEKKPAAKAPTRNSAKAVDSK